MLTIYAPFNNRKSKAWEVFNGVEQAWPEQVNILDNSVASEPMSDSMYWGFVNNNMQMIKKLEQRKHRYWFTDTPYFGRFDNDNLKPDNHTGVYARTRYMPVTYEIASQTDLRSSE